MIEIAKQLSEKLQHTTETFSDPKKLYITFFYTFCPSEGLPNEEVCILCVREDSIKIIDVLQPKRFNMLHIELYTGILTGALDLIEQAKIKKQEELRDNIDKAIKEANKLLGREE